jgi:dolichol-phosphate mannosyltransferase
MYKIFLQDKDKIDVVQGVRTDRAIDTFFKRNSANFFYKLMQKLIGSQVIPHAGDFRMMTFESVKIILNQKTRKKIYRFLIPQMGFRVEKISYVRSERFAGETKYPLGKMLKLAVESITEFSSKPLRILAKIGVTIAFISLILTAVIFIAHFSFAWIPGWASLVTLFLSINGFVIFAVGILGVYIAEIFDEIKSNITIYDEI